MISEWRVVPLGAIATQVTVGHVGSMASEYVADGIPFLRSTNIKPHRIDRHDVRYITPKFHERLAKSSLRPGDVVVVRTGAPGTAAVVPQSLPVANCADLVLIRPSGQVLSRYLSYYINSVAQGHIRSRLVGAVQQHFNVGAAKQLPVKLPPLEEQYRIVEVLGALDDKIELNREMNRTLEATAQAIFQSWFVDFDPVVAKADGRKPFGMGDELAALFPDRFVESELGPTPEGWEVSTIGEEVETVGGSTPSTRVPEYWKGGDIRWATPKDLSGQAHAVLLDTDRKITQDGLRKISSGLLSAGTVLMSSRAPVGYLAIAATPLAINQGFIAMRCEGRLRQHYVLWWAHEEMNEIKARSGGTTFAEISKRSFRPIPIVVPRESIHDSWHDVADALHSQVVENERESRILADLRDLLLPKLLSGEIRVREAEDAVEAAV